MVNKTLKRMSARISPDLEDRLKSKVFSIKSHKPDFTIEQAVKIAIENWLKLPIDKSGY